MLLIIILLVFGILVGFFIISRDKTGKVLKAIGRAQQIATISLLFVMGVWLGGNPDFWRDIKVTGLFGFLIALATIAGSVLVVFLFSKLMPKEEKL